MDFLRSQPHRISYWRQGDIFNQYYRHFADNSKFIFRLTMILWFTKRKWHTANTFLSYMICKSLSPSPDHAHACYPGFSFLPPLHRAVERETGSGCDDKGSERGLSDLIWTFRVRVHLGRYSRGNPKFPLRWMVFGLWVVKIQSISCEVWPRTLLEACTFGAHLFTNRSPFILDPRLGPVSL